MTAAAPGHYPAAPAHPCHDLPVMKVPDGMRLHPIGMLNGNVLYRTVNDCVPPSDSTTRKQNTSTSKKRRKREKQHDDGRPYIKKPPNAFMLYLKEQRPCIMSQLNINNNAAASKILGQRWMSMSAEEQSKYFIQANIERRLHAQRHPDWTPNGIKRKRPC